MSVKKRAEMRVPKLRAMLEGETSLRLKPHLWGRMERRKRHQAALKRAEYVVKYGARKRSAPKRGFARLASDTPDPADFED
jgi:hypothetical protein